MPGFRQALLALPALLLAAACAGPLPAGAPATPPPTSVAATVPAGSSTSTIEPIPPSITRPPTSLFGNQGLAVVGIGDVRYEFFVSECRVEESVFIVEGDDESGSVLYLRHASPPTRQPPEPSMSSLMITGNVEVESAPASVSFETYDVERAVAAGSAWLTTDEDEPSATFSVECS